MSQAGCPVRWNISKRTRRYRKMRHRQILTPYLEMKRQETAPQVSTVPIILYKITKEGYLSLKGLFKISQNLYQIPFQKSKKLTPTEKRRYGITETDKALRVNGSVVTFNKALRAYTGGFKPKPRQKPKKYEPQFYIPNMAYIKP